MGMMDRDYVHEKWRKLEEEEKRVKRAWYSPRALRRANRPPSPPPSRGRSIDALIIIAALLAAGVIWNQQREPTPELPFPESSQGVVYSPWPTGTRVAPFSVEAPPAGKRSPERHYYVTVSNWETGAPVLSMFVRAGEIGRTELPIGSYRVTVAEGSRWYGPQRTFGRKTVTTEGLRPATLTATPQGVIGGTLRLSGVINGNFPTKPVENR